MLWKCRLVGTSAGHKTQTTALTLAERRPRNTTTVPQSPTNTAGVHCTARVCLPRAHGGPATLGASFSNLQLFERSTLSQTSQPKYILAGERNLCQESHVSLPLAGISCCHALFCYLRSDFQEAQLSQHIKSREVQAGREKFSSSPPFQVSPKASQALCEVNPPDVASQAPNKRCAKRAHSRGSG